MNIYDWVFQKLGNEGIDSVREEHNRYIRPPKDIPAFHWFVMLSRAKYGDIVSGKVFKDKEKG